MGELQERITSTKGRSITSMPAVGRHCDPRQPGSTVPREETVEAFDKITKGDFDHFPEQAFLGVGGLEDLEKKYKEITKK